MEQKILTELQTKYLLDSTTTDFGIPYPYSVKWIPSLQSTNFLLCTGDIRRRNPETGHT